MDPEQNSEVISEKETPSALKTLHTVTPFSKYLAMVLFIILPFLGGWVGYKLAPEKVIEMERVVVESEENIPNDSEILRNAYATERFYDSEYGGDCGDAALVYYDENGTRKVIEKSLGVIVEPLQINDRNYLCKGSLGLVTFHVGQNKVFLRQQANEGGGDLRGTLYEYDVATGNLRSMKINESLGTLRLMSPDSTRIVSVKYERVPGTEDSSEYQYRSQEIIIANLLTDTSVVALDLSNDAETFVGSWDGHGPFASDTFRWFDENTLEYKVFDVTTTEYGNGNWGHPYLESRTLSLDPIEQDVSSSNFNTQDVIASYLTPYSDSAWEKDYAALSDDELSQINDTISLASLNASYSEQQKIATEKLYQELFVEKVVDRIHDAPSGRSNELVGTKLCVTRAIILEDRESAVEQCIGEDKYPNDIAWATDDITAEAQVAPFYVTGLYFFDNNPDLAIYYLSQVVRHYEIAVERWEEDYFKDVAGENYANMVEDATRKLFLLSNS